MLIIRTSLRYLHKVSILNVSYSPVIISRSLSGFIPARHKHFKTQLSESFSLKLLGCAPLCANHNSSLVKVPSGTRGIIIGRLYNWASDLHPPNLSSILDTFNHSTLVTASRDTFLWMETATSLPWWVNIVVTTVLLRTLLYVPAAVYLERWTAAREKFTLDSVPINARLRNAAGSRERVRELVVFKKQLIAEHSCQTYKFVSTLLWQITNMVVLSAGVRQCLFSFGGSGLREAVLPWGTELGYPDPLFILPLLNVALNIILIEMEAWKTSLKNQELEMSLRRVSLQTHGKNHIRSQKTALLVRRISCVFLLIIYLSVPSSLTLLWSVMLIYTLAIKLALLHPQVRRSLRIPERCYETPQPHRDFLLYLGTYLNTKSSLK